MDADRLSRWLTLGANVGILLGLILVGFEISQNSALVRAEIINSAFSDQQARAVARVGENSAEVWARSIEDPSTISLADVQVMEADLMVSFLGLRRAALMEEIGVFTGRWRQDYEWLSRPFTTPIGRAYWNYWYDDSINWMREMQPIIENAAPTTESDYVFMLQDSLSPIQQ